MRLWSIVVGVVCIALFGGTRISAQQPRVATKATVQQTAFDRAITPLEMPQSVTFDSQATQIGDQTEQKMDLEMRLRLTMRRDQELIGKNQTTVRTSQRRVVTAVAVDAGRTMAVKVFYPEATKQLVGADAPTSTAEGDAAQAISAVAQYPPVAQPVQGKTYLCRREPGDDGKLIVTDEAGHQPPKEEYDIVAPQMEMVGRPNPLAQFLAGRTVAVGERLEVPKQLAKQIFNLGDKFGEVTDFTLTLQKVQREGGSDHAVFLADVDAMSNDASQMRLEVEGPLVVQVDSCRAARINLVGPIGMSETRGSYSTAYQVIGTGRLQMNIASAFHPAVR